MSIACGIILGATYMKENFISDMVNQLDSPNDEYDSFLPFVMAEHDASADTVELNKWNDKTYIKHNYVQSQNGFIEEYYDELLCDSFILIPGISLLPNSMMGVVYIIALGYLFLGIAIISDIFMESIEEITSQTKQVELFDNEGQKKFLIETPVWNETVANLTLMALGSSAPEILLSVIQTMQDLTAVPPELGASTIVGSASFNLLVISGVSIMAVEEEPKKVKDTGVFAVTSIASLFAYIWLYLCLSSISPGYVTMVEAWLTLAFFFILIIFAFWADRLNAYIEETKQNSDQIEEKNKQDEKKIKKNQLRQICKEYGENNSLIVEIAQGINTQATKAVPTAVQNEIRELYAEILGTDKLASQDIQDLLHCLQPDSLLERFAYRKQAGVHANSKEFIKMKGSKGQIDHSAMADKVKVSNEFVKLKCLHYSVTESNGTVDITIIKNTGNDFTFGYRTVDDSATAPKDYKHFDQVVTMGKKQTEYLIQIPINDDEEWNPDLDFFVELYDADTKEKLNGDDTRCKVTILDEDFPGTLGFQETEVTVQRGAKNVDITVTRQDGSDGTIYCMLSTEQLSEIKTTQSAQEFQDYVPCIQKVQFPHQTNEVSVSIELVDLEIQKIDKIAGDKVFDEEEKKEEDGEESDEECDLIFKVRLDKPEPEGVKISKRNICLVTICSGDHHEKEDDDHAKLIEYFMNNQNPSWTQQFKNAVMLGPQIDEDNMILEDISLSEGLGHFATIGWKVFFSLVPPANYSGGYPAFLIALAMIGIVTAIVGEVATVLGCCINLKESVTAITFVALGTSLPDTFASMTAARNAEYADAAIGNITGSNSVNVFLGLGLPWVIACTYWQSKGLGEYEVPAGDLAFSVFIFLCCALVCFVVLIGRRIVIGGELGGPQLSRNLSAYFLFGLWFFYITMSTLKAYGVINVDTSG